MYGMYDDEFVKEWKLATAAEIRVRELERARQLDHALKSSAHKRKVEEKLRELRYHTIWESALLGVGAASGVLIFTLNVFWVISAVVFLGGAFAYAHTELADARREYLQAVADEEDFLLKQVYET